jgi:SulP family sulfate permease
MNLLLKKNLPFLNWIGEIKNPKIFRADVIAGISVALLLVPQSMAFAQLADLPPYYGLYAAFIPPAIAALFGSSRQLAAGPVATASLITATTLQSLAIPGTQAYFTYAIALALIIGIIRLIIGFCKLGIVTNFLSFPVIAGFTNAVAIMIFSSQIPNAFGVEMVKSPVYIKTVWNSITHIFTNFNLSTTLMFALALVILIIARKFSKKLPAIIFAVAVTTLIAWKLGYNGQIVGTIPKGIPSLKIPVFDFHALPTLLIGAITITLVGLMEVVSIAKTVAAKTHQHIDVNQEIIGQGMASFLGSFFQSYPVSSSFSRTAVNFKSGARTGFSSVVASLMVAITLLFLTPVFYYLPKATLAAAIMFSIVTFINFKPFIETWRVNKYDSMICVTTFVVTLAFAPRLYIPILSGVILSLVFYFYRTFKNDKKVKTKKIDTESYKHISIIHLDSHLYFMNCAKFEDKILKIIISKPEIDSIILDMENINYIDSSATHAIEIIVNRLVESGINLYFTNLKENVFKTFINAGLFEFVGSDYFFNSNKEAVEEINRDLKLEI